MRPDAPLYEHLEAAGQLQILVAREAGRMVGYMLFIVRPHPHYADVLCGFEDAYFLAPAHRKGWTGIRLIRESMRYLKARGVQRVFIHTKLSKDVGRALKFLGLAHTDEIYSAWIGD
jgi:GNAT superfamily N-acetyltransferase